MLISRQPKMSINIFVPSVGKWFDFSLKNRYKLCFSDKTFASVKAVSLTCWAGLIRVGALLSSLYHHYGLQGSKI